MKKKIEEIKKLAGRINIDDVDRNEDLMWFVSDLWNIEKHLNTALYTINEKLSSGKLNEQQKIYYENLFKLASEILKKTREERTKHLKRLYFIREFGMWCSVKHFLGVMAQAGEVMAKDIHIALEKQQLLEKTKDEKERKALEEEIKKDWENVKIDLETSKFAHDIILLMKKFSEKFKK